MEGKEDKENLKEKEKERKREREREKTKGEEREKETHLCKKDLRGGASECNVQLERISLSLMNFRHLGWQKHQPTLLQIPNC